MLNLKKRRKKEKFKEEIIIRRKSFFLFLTIFEHLWNVSTINIQTAEISKDKIALQNNVFKLHSLSRKLYFT